MKNRIEFYAGLNTYAPGWQETMPQLATKISGREFTAEDWAEMMWAAYQSIPEFRWEFDFVSRGGGVLVA